MNTLPPSAAPFRNVRNIKYCSSELEPLLPNSPLKLPATTLNAYAAVVQSAVESSPLTSPDFVFFSSWIPAIIAGLREDGGPEGSIRGHIKAAVSYMVRIQVTTHLPQLVSPIAAMLSA